jgi:hypothetical protein
MKLKIIFYLLITTSLIYNFSCDGMMRFRVDVLENDQESMIVSDSIYNSYSFKKPISNAALNFYSFDVNDSIYRNIFMTFYSDSAGYFYIQGGTGMGKTQALLTVSKKGYETDSIYFEYEHSFEPINFIVNLKKQ